MTKSEPRREPATSEPRAKDEVWCAHEHVYVPRRAVAEHLVTVHGVPRRHVIQQYGGAGGQGRGWQ